MPTYRAAPVHYLIAEHLEAVERGEIKRLMIFMPPRTGKSELLIRFIAWCLGRNPDWSMIYTSYGADLAWEKSHEARNAVASEEFSSVFGRQSLAEQQVELSKSSRSVQRWRIQGRRGGLTAQGVGGPLTGKGAHIAIIDDPVKNREEADSFRVREHTWRWYVSTLYTRLEPAGAVILVMTRWHVDDLAGRLLERAASDPLADQWHVLSLPALAEEHDALGRQPGQALNRERFDEAALASIQTTVGRREWLALYQQRPVPAEGAMFQRQWFNLIGAAPVDAAARVRYWDKAATSGGGDWSVGLLMARTRDGRFVVEDVVRGQWSSQQRNRSWSKRLRWTRADLGQRCGRWSSASPAAAARRRLRRRCACWLAIQSSWICPAGRRRCAPSPTRPRLKLATSTWWSGHGSSRIWRN